METALKRFLNFTVEITKYMTITTHIKKFYQAIAATSVSISILAAMTSAASAANFQQFKLSGTFANEPFSTDVDGLISQLAGGSFDGTYVVDVDELPANDDIVDLESWTINLRNSSNDIVRTLSDLALTDLAEAFIFPELPGFSGDILVFVEDEKISEDNFVTTLLGLNFNSDFTGIGTGNLFEQEDGQLAVGTLLRFEDDFESGIYVTSVTSELQATPEPVSVSGIAVVAAIGFWMKRRQKTIQSA